MTKCVRCQFLNAKENRFCEFCGDALGESTCASCNSKVHTWARFCWYCGTIQGAGRTKDSKYLGVNVHQDGERKQVSVLFADIRGATSLIQSLDPEVAMQQLDPVLSLMSKAVTKYGGLVNSVQGDGIMALFGAPAACEDHAVRACLAACEIHELVKEAKSIHVQVRIGIDSGELVVRTTGSDVSDVGVTGVVAHVAHRMEQHATAGTTCITVRTARLARGYVDLAPLGRLVIRGLEEPLESFKLLNVLVRSSWEIRVAAQALNRFVGRGAELSQLSTLLGRAELGHGQVITIIADAGFGKSRLIHQFLLTLPTGLWNVLRAAAVPYTSRAPYHLATEILKARCGLEDGDDRENMERKMVRSLAIIDPQARMDVAPLRALLGLEVEGSDWSNLAPTVRRNRTIASLRAMLLSDATVRPLIVHIEDYQWIDPASAGFLDALIDGAGAAKILVIITTRKDGRPHWTHRSYCHLVHLLALEPENSKVLLQELVGELSVSRELQQQILDQAGGVPLFIEEIVRSLVESNAIAPAVPAGSTAPASTKVLIPASLQSTIAARIDRLPAPRRRLLQIASVIGQDVPLNILEAVADIPPEQIAHEISGLLDSEFLYELNLQSGLVYTFKHALIHAVVYEEMLRLNRRDLHARVMRAIERLYSERLHEFTERLVDHAQKGEVWESSVSYGITAGDRAIERWAWKEAVVFYEIAIHALTNLPDNETNCALAIDARLRLRVALPGVAGLARISDSLAEAKEIAEASNHREKLPEIITSQCLAFTKLGQLDKAIAAGRTSQAMTEKMGDKSAHLNASFALAQAYWYQGGFDHAQKLLTDRIEDIRGPLRRQNTGTTGTASMLALVCLAKTYAITGQRDKAFSTILEARSIAQETSKPFDLSYCGVGFGFCLLLQDQPEAAAAELEVALELAHRGDIALLVPSSLRYLGRAYTLVGRLDDARIVLEDALERTRSAGLLGMQLWSSAAFAHLQSIAGSSEARDCILDVLSQSRLHGFRPVEVHALRLFANHVVNRENDLQQGEALYRQSLALANQLGMVPEAILIQRDMDLMSNVRDLSKAIAATRGDLSEQPIDLN